MLKGKMQVVMRFEIPVSEGMYPGIKNKNDILGQEMTEQQIIAAEEANYNSDPDEFLDAIRDNISSVSFDFVRSQERWDES
ncbi:hypothetical protein DRO27_05320 [Candidatus Bathyarchaeota archaeon]|nr:MAG: hypothetical protein DRO27_05320 [Candidatus Bathyarchaeota archaeon]